MPPSPPTIAAIASGQPPARGHRAIIRLSGPAAHHAVLALTRGTGVPPVRRLPNAESRIPSARPLRLHLAGTLTLPLLATFWHAPRSFTGEDAAELLLPGNPYLAQRVLAALTTQPGVRPAEPGEFTARAYLAGKLTLAQAEGVAMTIAAAGAEDLAAAREVMSGEFGRRVTLLADELAAVLALVEAGIDFADEEGVVAIAPDAAAARIQTVAADLDRLLGSQSGAPVDDHRPAVALIGPPNAGKSTLFNALLGRPRAVVAPVAGTTRDALAEPLTLPDGTELTLIDLPGDDESAPASAPDAAARAAARPHAQRSAVLIACDPLASFAFLSQALPSPPDPAPRLIRVRTKADRAPANPTHQPASTLAVCALDGTGLDALRAAITNALGEARPAPGLRPHHRLALRDARRGADEAAAVAAPELRAQALRAALAALGPLTGRLEPDAVLGRIFATFCIGK